MTVSKICDYAFYFIYALCCIRFYSYVGFNDTLVKLSSFVIYPLMFFLCLNQLRRKGDHALYKYMQWILLSVMLSFFSAWAFWGQSFLLTYRATASMFSFLLFFYLYKKRPPIEFLEKYVLFFGILYCILWLYAFSQIPRLVFGFSEEGVVNESLTRGIIRLHITGDAFLVFSFFIAINKFYTVKRKLFLLLAAIFYVFIMLKVTRQVIILSALVALCYIYLKNKKLSIAVATIILLFWILGNNIKLKDDGIVASLLALTERQVEDNEKEEDIRITEYRYFFTQYTKKPLAKIIGNGMPQKDSSYGQYLDKLHTYNKLFITDVGYAMMYVVTGVVGLLLYLLLFFKCAFTKVPDELVYARMFMIYFIFANIAASWYAKADCQLCMAISVYILMMYGQNNAKKRKRKFIVNASV